MRTPPGEVADLAVELAAAGAVGINLEDGRADFHLADPGHQYELIAAVKERVPGLFVNARTDTYWLKDAATPKATLARAERYVAAGADGIFAPGVAEDSDIKAIVEGMDAPLNVLYLPDRHTIRQLADLGVRRISTGSLLFRTALHSIVETAQAIRNEQSLPAKAPGYAEIHRLTYQPT